MGFELPRVDKCCCCNLRTGALIIGYFSVVSILLCIISIITLIVTVSLYVDKNMSTPPPGHTVEDVQRAATILYALYAFQLFLYTFYLIISLLLVIGAHKYRPQYMKYYFIAGMVNFVLSLCLIAVNFVFTGFVTTLIQLLICALLFYFLIVVRSSYLEMEEQQKLPTLHLQPRVFEMQDINTKQQQPLMA